MLQNICQRADVLVNGGTLEGCIAAAELAKAGKRVILVEQRGFLGGSLTGCMEVYLPETPEDTCGYADTIRVKAGLEEAVNGPLVHDQKCKLVLSRMLVETGVRVYTHLFLLEGKEEADQITAIYESKTGRMTVTAAAAVDASAYGELCGAMGFGQKKLSNRVFGAVKMNQIPEEALITILDKGYSIEGSCILGKISRPLCLSYPVSGNAETKQYEEPGKVVCGKGAIRVYYNRDFGETVFCGISVDLPVANPFALSSAVSCLRSYTYDYRNSLRKTVPGFEQTNIIHVSPSPELYGLRCFDIPDGSRIICSDLRQYDNMKAIQAGLAMAEAALRRI